MQRLAVIFIFMLVAVLPKWVQAEVLLIAQAQVSADSVSRNEVRIIFLMRRLQWPDGSAVKVFVLDDDNELHKSFCKQYMQVYPRRLRKAWERQIYSGTGQAPTHVESVQEMLQRVGSTPGAIGYLPENMINDSVKVLSVR